MRLSKAGLWRDVGCDAGRDSIETGSEGWHPDPWESFAKHEAFEAPARTKICVTIARVPAPKEGARIWKWMTFGILHLRSLKLRAAVSHRFECPLADEITCWSVRHT